MIIYLLIILIFVVDFVTTNFGGAARIFSWTPEILSGLVAIQVVFNLMTKREMLLSVGYIFVFITIAFLILSSVIANAVQPGAVFAGIRNYVKYMPFFFLPLVVPVSGTKIQAQLKLVLVLVLLQVPVSFYQRFVQHAGLRTGDVVKGTLVSPSALTFMCLSTIAVIISAYYKKRISLKYTVILAGILMIPPTINETTITLFLLPLSFFIPSIIFARQSKDKAKLFAMIFIGFFAILVFAVAYNSMYGERWGGSITNLDRLAKDAISEEDDDTMPEKVRRIDSIILAAQFLSNDVTKFAMGVGIGNAAPSFSEKFIGEYSSLYTINGGYQTALGHLLWEVGILGVMLIMTLFIFIFIDSYALAYKDGTYGSLALAWGAILSFVAISLVYKNIIPHNTESYLFWYFSGCIVAERYRNRIATVSESYNFSIDSK